MFRSSLCDCSDSFILVKGTITVENNAAVRAATKNANKMVIFKNCAPFTSFISRISNTQVDDAQYIDVLLPMHNLIKHSDNYSNTCGVLLQYCRDEQVKLVNATKKMLK